MVTLADVERSLSRYDGEDGLVNLERAFGVNAKGDVLQRVKAVAAEIQHQIERWERMRTFELLRDHARFAALFTTIDRADMYAFSHNPEALGAVGDKGITWPDCWWGLLAARLDDCGLWRRLWDQIHRETHAVEAAPTMKEERSMAASRNGKRAGVAAKAKAAAWHADCARKAREMLKQGRAPRTLAAILAARFHKTPRQVRTALQAAGVLHAKKTEVS